MTWDLTPFYQSFDDPALRADIDRVKAILVEGAAFVKDEPDDVRFLEGSVRYEEELNNRINRSYSYCSLTLATDTNNQVAFRVLDELSNLLVEAQVVSSAFTRRTGAIADLEGCIARSELLQANAFVLRESKERAAHMMDESLEKWMLRMSLSGGDAFSKLRDKLMGTLTATLDGKELPLPAVRGMAYDPDAETRKKAYEAELACYAKVETAMAFCLAGIKGEALTMCEARHYPDVLTEQLDESRMDRATLDALLQAIRESLPAFRKYLRKKAELLGHPDGLPFYDLFAPVGESNLRYTVEEARALLVDVFTGVSPEMGAFMRHAFDNRWIDMLPKEGKEGGAFCAGNHELDISRVLTNFVGSFSDVSTLAHELGHAWHNRCMKDVPVLLCDEPMPLAETASIFNETLLSHAVQATADERQRLTLLENSLMESTQVIVDIYSRYLFETKVFAERATHPPSVEELNQWMLDAQEAAYGDGLSKDARHPYMWVNKSHYYNVGLHFYNFPYAFGLLFGLGVFAKYQAQGAAFLPQYNALLARCGGAKVADVAASVDIDVRSADYWRGALDIIRKDVDEFCALADRQLGK